MVLVSHDSANIVPEFMQEYTQNRVFGTYKDNKTANTGLYMGYCSHLKMVLDQALVGESDDDQNKSRSQNLIFHKYLVLFHHQEYQE
jgi:hypothetical protein